MKLIFRSYMASLRERQELDAILPDLLSELGYTVYSRPQRGSAEAGVDIAAVGRDEAGEEKLYLFSVKRGDLTRKAWNDGTPQALRPSLESIQDRYIPHRVPKQYQHLKIVICMVFGGDMQVQVRSDVEGYVQGHTNDKVSFEEWNGDKLAGLLMQGLLREEIMPKDVRSHFQKAIAMVDAPEVALQHFTGLVEALSKAPATEKERVLAVRQMYIALWVLFVWARDVGNVEAPYLASELVLLCVWNLLRPYIDKAPSPEQEAISIVLNQTIALHFAISDELLTTKILPHVGTPHAISMAIRANSHVDVNLKLFDLLGRIAMAGLWINWMGRDASTAEAKAEIQSKLERLSKAGLQLINSNPALFLPLQDIQSVEVALFLLLVAAAGEDFGDMHAWLQEMTHRLVWTIRAHGRYPCVFTDYRDLLAHPCGRSDEYRERATAGSTLIPLIAAFLASVGDAESVEHLRILKNNELQHCTLQLWMPDDSSEDYLYTGTGLHGIALCELPLTADGQALADTLDDAFAQDDSFNTLSAIATGYWPIVLVACRHHRLPVPPQFWRPLARPSPSAPANE